MRIEDIELIQNNIESVLQSSVDPENPTEIRSKLTEISTLIGNAVLCVTASKRIMIVKRGEWLRQHTEKIKGMTPTQSKEYVNTAVIDEQMLYARCENNYDALKKSGDMLISVLSHHKTEMNHAGR